MDLLFVALICVGPQLAMLAIIAIAMRGAPKLKLTTVGLAFADAFVGWVCILFVRAGLEIVLHPDITDYDFFSYFIFPAFGAVLGMATVFLWALRQDLTRSAARNLLLVVSVIVIPLHLLNLYELATPFDAITSWRGMVLRMSDSVLPILWLAVLWAFWAWRFARSGTEEALHFH